MLIIRIYIFNGQFFDVVNDVNQDFSLKYSNNKMGINDVINKLSINNTRANLLH
jgi:hypothetical protein